MNIFLPHKAIQDLRLSLSPEMIAYLFPGMTKEQFDAALSGETGNVEPTLFDEQIEDGIRFSISGSHEARYPQIGEPKKKKTPTIIGDIRFSKVRKEDPVDRMQNSQMQLISAEEELYIEEQKMEDIALRDEAKAQRIMEEIQRIEKDYGVNFSEIERIVDYKTRPSRLHITAHGKILLLDFDRKEVKMDTLTKVIFILYLQHPDGIDFSDIHRHKFEMMRIYGRISHRLNQEDRERSIDRLCSPEMDNSLYEKVSKVKRAFNNAIDKRIAKHYYIKPLGGTIRGITLDRSLVSMG